MATPILFYIISAKSDSKSFKAKLLKRSAMALHYTNANKMQRRAGSPQRKPAPRDLLQLDFRAKLFEFLLQLLRFFFFQAFFNGFRRTVYQILSFF
jgi:hypothetical protein